MADLVVYSPADGYCRLQKVNVGHRKMKMSIAKNYNWLYRG